MQLQAVGTDHLLQRQLLLACLSSVEDWPATTDAIESPHFVALVAMDADDVSNETLSKFLRKLLQEGMVYLCAWGPDCKRVHDIADQERDLAEPPPLEDDVVMTTWHAGEPLGDTVEFAVVACPTDSYLETCRAVVAIVVEDESWADEVRRLLTRLSSTESL